MHTVPPRQDLPQFVTDDFLDSWPRVKVVLVGLALELRAEQYALLDGATILDRSAFTAGPFWEATPDERAQVADLIGMPAVDATIEVDPDGAPRVTTAASPLLALAIFNEIAIELVTTENPSISRPDAIARIRARTAELLADEGNY